MTNEHPAAPTVTELMGATDEAIARQSESATICIRTIMGLLLRELVRQGALPVASSRDMLARAESMARSDTFPAGARDMLLDVIEPLRRLPLSPPDE